MLETGDSDQAIDFVVLWVDGSDAALTEKRRVWMQKEGLSDKHSASLPTRFASANEIRYCILSIFRNAPFTRKVFIVTDGQDPGLDQDLEHYFPERLKDVQIVDHKEVFKEHGDLLPTFNSTSISTMLWQIEGLADQFIYINDDNFLLRPTRPEDWFNEGRPVLRHKRRVFPLKKLAGQQMKILVNRGIRGKKDYQPRLTSYLRLWNGARLAGFRLTYFFHDHTPHPISRMTLHDYFNDHPGLLRKNAEPRFRTGEQFLITGLAYHLEHRQGNRHRAGFELCYLHPIYSAAKMKRKIERCRSCEKIRFLCVQSMEMMETGQQQEVFDWLEEALEMKEGV